MFDTLAGQAPVLGVAELSDVALGLTQVSFAACADTELLGLLHATETARRQIAYFDQLLLAELTQRGVAPASGTAAWPRCCATRYGSPRVKPPPGSGPPPSPPPGRRWTVRRSSRSFAWPPPPKPRA